MDAELKDITIVCQDCGEDFTFTVGEQQFYKEKGLENSPVRCKACRDKKRANNNRNDRPRYNSNREEN